MISTTPERRASRRIGPISPSIRLARLPALGETVARKVDEELVVSEPEVVEMLRAPGCLGDESQPGMVGQGIDGRGLAGIGAAGEGYLGDGLGRQVAQMGDGDEETCVAEQGAWVQSAGLPLAQNGWAP